jgi:cullin 1
VEGMLTDTNAATPFVKQFQDSDSFKGLPIEFDVKVLTDGYWPSFKSPPVVLPIEINSCIEAFNKFYIDRNKMKHLSWSYMHGKCNILARFTDKEYTLVLTTYQTSIIMLFNDNESLSFKDIKDLLKTEDGLLEMMLDSLSCKRYKLLSKTGQPKSIGKEDTFRVNDDFKNKLKLISVPAPIIKETFNKEKVDIDRTYAIDAAVVKIMKSRKKMSYMHLLNEVMAILQMFRPTSLMIKNRIETLIDRDYMERDSEDNNVFRYLA